MENDIAKKLEVLETKIDMVYESAEKTRKYFLWTMILSFVLFLLPLVGLVFAIPTFMSNYVGGFNGL